MTNWCPCLHASTAFGSGEVWERRELSGGLMLLPWQQGFGGHPGFPLLRGSIRLGEHRLCRHQILTWTHTCAHTHTHTASWFGMCCLECVCPQWKQDEKNWRGDAHKANELFVNLLWRLCIRNAKVITTRWLSLKKEIYYVCYVLVCPSSSLWRQHQAKLRFTIWQVSVTSLISTNTRWAT